MIFHLHFLSHFSYHSKLVLHPSLIMLYSFLEPMVIKRCFLETITYVLPPKKLSFIFSKKYRRLSFLLIILIIVANFKSTNKFVTIYCFEMRRVPAFFWYRMSKDVKQEKLLSNCAWAKWKIIVRTSGTSKISITTYDIN